MRDWGSAPHAFWGAWTGSSVTGRPLEVYLLRVIALVLAAVFITWAFAQRSVFYGFLANFYLCTAASRRMADVQSQGEWWFLLIFAKVSAGLSARVLLGLTPPGHSPHWTYLLLLSASLAFIGALVSLAFTRASDQGDSDFGRGAL
jgi:uncharacterized membrane protein YhaH (DUF805 family)